MEANDHFRVTSHLLMKRIESLEGNCVTYRTMNEEILASRIAKLSEETDVFAVANKRLRHYNSLLQQMKYTEAEIDHYTDIYRQKIIQLISKALRGPGKPSGLNADTDAWIMAN